jgi:aspartate kinase
MTAVIVRKYGGEALASPSRIRAAAERIVARAEDVPIVVVASARRGVTDHLLELVREVGARRASRSADRAVAAGEIVSAALLAAAIEALGRKAVALDGREAGLVATGNWASARLRQVQPRRIRQILSAGAIPVVAGFQARRRRGLATLGRGGSDLTAVALAGALGGACELLKDVPSLHTADPKLCAGARPLSHVSHRFLVDLARAGARVCHPRAAVVARQGNIPLRFAHFQDEAQGTLVGGTPSDQVAIVLRRDVAMLSIECVVLPDDSALRRLWRALREIDGTASLMIRRHVNGARISIVLARNAEPAARTHIEWAGFRLGGGPRGPLDALTVIGAPHVQRHARLRAAMTAAEALPLRVSATRRRLLLTVPPEASIALLEALHGEFVEDAAEVRCSA